MAPDSYYPGADNEIEHFVDYSTFKITNFGEFSSSHRCWAPPSASPAQNSAELAPKARQGTAARAENVSEAFSFALKHFLQKEAKDVQESPSLANLELTAVNVS